MIQPGWRKIDPRLTVVDGALALIALIVIVQIWLLTATLESYLAGHYRIALPALLVSGALLALAGALIYFVNRKEREEPRDEV